MVTVAPSTVAELTVATLIANGIDTLYCLPGVQNDPFFDALFDRSADLRPVHTRHEQGACYMANGAAQATGQPQAFCVVPGPGFLNASGALCTGFAVGARTLALVGEIPSHTIGRGFGVLHEITDQLSILKGLTKQAERVTGGEDAAAVLQRAMASLASGRPRPVGIEVPTDVWRRPIESLPTSLVAHPPEGPAVDAGLIDEAAAVIRGARSPMIVVGGGAQDFSAEITQLVDLLSAAAVAFRNGHGVVSHDNPMRVGMPAAHDLWPKVDVVIGLGTRLNTQQMQWGVDDDLKIVHIDIDADEIGRVCEPTVGINADLADALPLLLAALEGQAPRAAWAETVTNTRARFDVRYEAELPDQLGWLTAIRDELPRDGIFVDELTQCGYVSRFAFPSYSPRTFISTGYQGTLGYGYATALGAANARPDVPVVNIAGDGGSLFTVSELATAVHHQIPLTTVVFTDNAFGNVKLLQRTNFDERFIASDLTSPDFVKLADAFGARGLRATTPTELRERLRESIGAEGPTLIEVPVGTLPNPWPFVLMPKVRGV